MGDDHPVLYVTDQFGQSRPWDGECLLCQRDALRSRLARELDGIKALEAVIVSRGERLAEAEALLREARMGVKNSAVQFGYPYTEYVDRIDAFLAPDSASEEGEK